ncbi:MAG: hypothetical protein R8K50_01795 [Mariprofundus sp.]
MDKRNNDSDRTSPEQQEGVRRAPTSELPDSDKHLINLQQELDALADNERTHKRSAIPLGTLDQHLETLTQHDRKVPLNDIKSPANIDTIEQARAPNRPKIPAFNPEPVTTPDYKAKPQHSDKRRLFIITAILLLTLTAAIYWIEQPSTRSVAGQTGEAGHAAHTPEQLRAINRAALAQKILDDARAAKVAGKQQTAAIMQDQTAADAPAIDEQLAHARNQLTREKQRLNQAQTLAENLRLKRSDIAREEKALAESNRRSKSEAAVVKYTNRKKQHKARPAAQSIVEFNVFE